MGRWSAPYAMKILKKVEVPGVKLASALAFAFFASYLAKEIGLAPIIGAFAAGSLKTLAVIPTLVAVSVAPIKRATLKLSLIPKAPVNQ